MSRHKFTLRTRYLIKKNLQLKYLSLVVFFAVFAGGIAGYTIYHTTWSLIDFKIRAMYDPARLDAVSSLVNSLLLKYSLVIIPFIILIAIIFSHRIAGPLYRLEKVLKEISKGNLNIRMHLRHGDELQEIAQVVNTVTANLSLVVKHQQDTIDRLTKVVQELKIVTTNQPNDTETIKILFRDFETYIKKMNKALKLYSVRDDIASPQYEALDEERA